MPNQSPPVIQTRTSFGVGSRQRAQSRVCVWGGTRVQTQTPRDCLFHLYSRSVPTCQLRVRPGGGGGRIMLASTPCVTLGVVADVWESCYCSATQRARFWPIRAPASSSFERCFLTWRTRVTRNVWPRKSRSYA